MSPVLTIGNSYAYVAQPYFSVSVSVPSVYLTKSAKVIASPTELIILENTEEVEAQPAMIFNAVLEYHT